MELHSVVLANQEAQIEALKRAQVKQKKVEPYSDPLREFARISRVEGMVRHWMTYPLDEKKRLIKDQFEFVPQMEAETDSGFENRQLERWRALSVILQEESRMRHENGAWVQGSPEIATACLKLLYPFHDWKPKAVLPPAEK
jgi:hypothetical protein